ncbi:uncharacterized protein G2W53_036948 [Senna tora]|uniref:Uncharacterized protein n=1 Tax=Senna tora TaxID=362788 RepID=A0A834STT2_9FABA|nr:uncharacterized protein G2W53_036948 [Senna tora]
MGEIGSNGSVVLKEVYMNTPGRTNLNEEKENVDPKIKIGGIRTWKREARAKGDAKQVETICGTHVKRKRGEDIMMVKETI